MGMLNTTAPLNTGVISETLSPWDMIGSIYENKIDKRILNEKNDKFSKYVTSITPKPILTGDTRNDTIVKNMTFIDYLMHLFKTYSEPFKSNVVLTDVETNKTYNLASNQELYNKNGELKIGKYDDTDYKGFIQTIQLKRDQLEKEKEKPAECNDTIKCIADFETNIGDKLCCGQKGVLKDTRYVCPENKPKCGNFKCGSKFGECS